MTDYNTGTILFAPLPDSKAHKLPRRTEATRVLYGIEQLCEVASPGDQIPTHRALMEQFHASERTVLNALNELQRRGRIVRRTGAGTFVAPKRTTILANMNSELPASDRKTIVAVVRPDQSVFDQSMHLLYGHAAKANCSLVCHIVGPDQDLQDVLTQLPTKPSGYILFSSLLEPLAKPLQEAGHQVVIFGTPYVDVDINVPWVCGDQERGGYLATKHLIDLGHTQVAIVYHFDNVYQNRRWLGHDRAILEAQRAGKTISTVILDGRETDLWADNPKLAVDYLRRPDAPTGIAMWNDHDAAYFMSSLLKAGIKVPAEVSVIGYDALGEGERLTPSLTTVDPILHNQLEAAVRMVSQSEFFAPNCMVVTMPTLLIRESTAPPKL